MKRAKSEHQLADDIRNSQYQDYSKISEFETDCKRRRINVSQSQNDTLYPSQISALELHDLKSESESEENSETFEQLPVQPEEASETEFCDDISELRHHGVSYSDIKRLKSRGINTITKAMKTSRNQLSSLKGLTNSRVQRIKESVAKIIKPNFVTALEASENRKACFRIGTGSEALDAILGGGIESQSITEFFGESRCGKTQIAHTMCVVCQLSSDDFNGGKAIYIDTEDSFRPDRLRAISTRFEIAQETTLNNVLYAKAFSAQHQMELIEYAAAKFHEEPGAFKLLVIDSIMNLLRIDFIERTLKERQQKLLQMMNRLQKIAETYNIAVVMTNQVTGDMSNDMEFASIPIGGHVIAHASTTRVVLKKAKGSLRAARIFDSPELPEDEALFRITSGGIDDAA